MIETNTIQLGDCVYQVNELHKLSIKSLTIYSIDSNSVLCSALIKIQSTLQ